MARIDVKDGRFWGLGTREEGHIFKAAGFKWSPRRRAWITDSIAIADAATKAYWTDAAIRFVEKMEAAKEVAVEQSWADDTDFYPPIPQALLDKGIDFKGYQRAGIEFAAEPTRKDILIADQPGLGKSAQAVGVSNCYPFDHKRAIRRVLVVCPASLKENWRREWKMWDTKGMSVGIASTQHREIVQDGTYKNGKPRFRKVVHPTWWPSTDVVIINYDILQRFKDEIDDVTWDMLVVDECHALKTPDSGRTLFILGDASAWATGNNRKKLKEARKKGVWFNPIECRKRLFLSGTPMMNRPIEMWPIVQAFDPDELGRDFKNFGYRYCQGWFDPMRGPKGAYDFTGASNKAELGQLMRRKFMVRRLKREVLKELPPKFRQVVLLESPQITELVAREDELAQALRLFEQALMGEPDEAARDAAIGVQVMQNAFKMGFDRAFEDGASADRPNARRLDLDYASAVLGMSPPAVQILFEEIAQVRRELGLAKVPAILPWVKDFLENDEKLILFAYHSDVVEQLREGLADYMPAVIYGKTPVLKRQGEVDRFQENDRCRIMIGNLHAAGVGFTMTRAKDVAFAEGDWTPTLIEQGEDRACRLGQTAEKIMSFFLMANGSLDARIAQACKEKEDNIHDVLDV